VTGVDPEAGMVVIVEQSPGTASAPVAGISRNAAAVATPVPRSFLHPMRARPYTMANTPSD
jgi:hypothetical protein